MFLTFATFGCKITNFFRHVQEKKAVFCIFAKKNLVMSKKSSTFARFFRKKKQHVMPLAIALGPTE